MRNTIATLLLCLLPHSVTAGDWPHWRGSGRNGVVSESSHFQGGTWPPGKPLWTANVNSGGSGPIVIGNRLYTMGWKNGRDTVWALDTKTGRVAWHQSYACPEYGRVSDGDKGLYSGPSSCPSYDTSTGYLYTLSTDGDLICWDTRRQGKRVWGLNLYEASRVPQRPKVGRRRLRDYGYTTAPLLHGETVIVEVGDDEGNLMAFSKKTGRRRWVSESKDPAGHTGGLAPMVVDGLPCLAVLTIRNLLVARLDQGHEGETVAEFPNESATPQAVADCETGNPLPKT